MLRSLSIRSLFILTAAAAGACGGEGGGGGGGDAGPVDYGPTSMEGIPDFTLGLTVTSAAGTYQLRVEQADPAPPQKFENDWVVDVLDMDGDPIADAELTFVQPWMPAPHKHDGTFDPTITAGSAPGQFAVDRINLWMGGRWEVRFDVVIGGEEDRATVPVWIED